MRAALVHGAIDAAALLAEVNAPSSGASTLFVGTVREVNEGRDVAGIDYSAYETMAQRELDAIARETCEAFATEHVVIEHRLGYLALTEASVAIAISHPHRGAAMDAMRYAIEELKRRVPIWKREHYVDGTREWVDPTRSGGTARAGESVITGAPQEGRA
ncbi:MAG: molybdenum cofactor biosynthesis protein MoaE [Gemmatimonadaceae bacterium]|nr:molybdenum cofactor biosynthesis protein MoaE [Gemmatimonadaceae bacterium]